MSYKTILIHLNDEKRARRLLETGRSLAQRCEAHLIGLHVFPAYRLTPPVPLPLGADVFGRIRTQIGEETDRIKTLFTAATAGLPIVAEWRAVTSERREAALIVMDHARAADLVIASQSDPDWDINLILDFPERIAIESGRPALVIPNRGDVTMPPQCVCIAWNGKREAARAVFDALPLLKMAQQVHVLAIAEGDVAQEGRLPEAEVAAALSRHGIEVTISKHEAGIASIGEQVHKDALAHRADLLVMGAFGHSRLREFVFGGVTRHVLREMQVPVFFSH
ncbi:MAG: universal stress protein [Hyphomicrobiaceae bacterium]